MVILTTHLKMSLMHCEIVPWTQFHGSAYRGTLRLQYIESQGAVSAKFHGKHRPEHEPTSRLVQIQKVILFLMGGHL